MTPKYLAADPYPWPYDGNLRTDNTALIVIDMQTDFCGPGGYIDLLGYDISLTRACIAPIGRVLECARSSGLHVLHTREGHRPDLSDCPPAKRARGRLQTGIGDAGPMGRILVRGEYGHDIVDELRPIPGEPVVDKPGKGAFYATDLELLLRDRGIKSLVVTGVTAEVCVQTTVREANDRGFECLVLSDCIASYFPEFYEMTLRMVTAQGGIFGWVAPSEAFLRSLPLPALTGSVA